MMTARDKFFARLKELGLADEYDKVGGGPVGKVMEDDSIVVLVHYECENDGYDELHYPPFEELWKNEGFRKACKEDFYDSDDDKFVAQLAYWLDIHRNGAKCPLYPADVYFVASGLETEAITFKDDEKTELLITLLKDVGELWGEEIHGRVSVGDEAMTEF